MTYCPNCGRRWEQGKYSCPGCGYYAGQFYVAPQIGASDVDPTFAGGAAGRETRKNEGVTWGVWQIVTGIILVIFSLFTAAAAAAVLSSLYAEQEDALATWISVHLMALGIVATVWFLGLRHSRYPLAALRLSGIRLPRKRTVLLVVLVLAASLFATSLYSIIVDLFDAEALSPREVDSDLFFDGFAVLLTFQALAFITPLSEEIFFRGFIFGGLLPRLGPWPAIVISALVFSAFHFSLGVLIPIPGT